MQKNLIIVEQYYTIKCSFAVISFAAVEKRQSVAILFSDLVTNYYL